MRYEIKDPKIDKDRILVSAQFFDESDTQVHEYNTAYALNTPADEILADVQKTGDLWQQEQVQAVEQAQVDELMDQAQATINQLISHE